MTATKFVERDRYGTIVGMVIDKGVNLNREWKVLERQASKLLSGDFLVKGNINVPGGRHYEQNKD